MRPFDAEEMASHGVTHDEMWSTYYVVSSTRNTWARAASGYDYTQDRWVRWAVAIEPMAAWATSFAVRGAQLPRQSAVRYGCRKTLGYIDTIRPSVRPSLPGLPLPSNSVRPCRPAPLVRARVLPPALRVTRPSSIHLVFIPAAGGPSRRACAATCPSVSSVPTPTSWARWPTCSDAARKWVSRR
jgi:hypothetical protein